MDKGIVFIVPSRYLLEQLGSSIGRETKYISIYRTIYIVYRRDRIGY